MPSPVYLDTSALVRRAEASAGSPSPRNASAGPPVASLISASAGRVATNEVGLLEFHDIVTLLWRDTATENDHYDEMWAHSAISQAMDDLAAGRLEILPTPPKAYEQAMTLVTMTTRDHGRKFRVWDAVHLVTAMTWAEELRESVQIWTTDKDFEGFLSLYSYFASSVSVRNLDD